LTACAADKMKKSREVAFLGIISALSVVILFLGALIEALDITAAVFSALMLLIAWQELKYKAVLVYLSTVVISFFFVAFSILPAVEYLIFGLYPILKPLIEKTPKVLAYVLKGVYIVLASVGSVIAMYLFVPASIEKTYMIAVYILMFAAVIILFDLLIAKFKKYYVFKLRRILRIDRFFR
jgi:hypothetical protein